ncbi:MAG: zinc-dependent peptidase [Ginsengibacter sp.]
MAPTIILISLLIVVALLIFYKKKKKTIPLPKSSRSLLQQYVLFYQKLDKQSKIKFEEKIQSFLVNARIKGVNIEVDELDKLLVASSAIIPVFYFDKWTYYNLDTVLLYPGTFNKDEFLADGYEKNTLGMIGNGPMQRIMILSKAALHDGFINEGKNNTGIHEFVHLLDKEDGDVDGLPEALLKRNMNSAWLDLVTKNMEAIMNGHSDINYYGASNKAEFFSVASEYFFNSPDLFERHHPELNSIMRTIFQVPE